MAGDELKPAGAPLIVSVDPEPLADLCRRYGAKLLLTGCEDTQGKPLDGPRLLWAISGCESEFGRDCKPRFEPGYYLDGGYYRKSEQVRQVVNLYGRAGACSYGPWQVLAINATHFTPERLGSDLDAAASAAVAFVNDYVLRVRQARNLVYILDTYNSGNWRDKNVPHEYIKRGVNFYQNFPMPPAGSQPPPSIEVKG